MSTSSGLYALVSTDSPTSLSEEDLNQSATSAPEMARARRKWQVFPGRNRFCCDGRVMMANESGVFYVTLFLILGTSGLFFGFDCPYLTVNISPAIPIVDSILFIFVMGTLLRTSFSDPGIIPRATPDEAANIEKQIEAVQEENNFSTAYRPPPRTKEILIRGQSNQLKYCFTCKIFRPPRASHCSVCDNCVERFDHHCPWVGNCVGLRNYRYFYLFIVSLALHCVFIFACVLTHLVLISQSSDFMTAIKATPASVVVGVICFFSVWSLLGLAGFHTYLVVSNQTTNEDIKGTFASRHGEDVFNPFSYGSILANYCGLVYGPIQPSLIDLRGVVPSPNSSSSLPNDHEEIEAVNVRHENYGTTYSTLPPANTQKLTNRIEAESPGCDGKGRSRPTDTDTPIHVSNVRDDAALVDDTVHFVSSFKHYVS